MLVAKIVAKTFLRVILFTMVVECALSARISERSPDNDATSISTKTYASIWYSSLVLQAEEEKFEEKSDKSNAVELIDLGRNISFLSRIHSPHRFFITEQFCGRPPLIKLFRVLNI